MRLLGWTFASVLLSAACTNQQASSDGSEVSFSELATKPRAGVRRVDFCGDGIDQDGDGADRPCNSPESFPVTRKIVIETRGQNEGIAIATPRLVFTRGTPFVQVENRSIWPVTLTGNLTTASLESNDRRPVPDSYTTLVGVPGKVIARASTGETVETELAWAPEPTEDVVALHLGGKRDDGKLVEVIVIPDNGESMRPNSTSSMDACLGMGSCRLNVRVIELLSDPATGRLVEATTDRHQIRGNDYSEFHWNATTRSIDLSRLGPATHFELEGDRDGLTGGRSVGFDTSTYPRMNVKVLGVRSLSAGRDAAACTWQSEYHVNDKRVERLVAACPWAVDWTGATNACKAMGGTLAIADTRIGVGFDQSNSVFRSTLKDGSGGVETTAFVRRSPTDMGPASPGTCLGIMQATSSDAPRGWRELDCASKQPFICEFTP